MRSAEDQIRQPLFTVLPNGLLSNRRRADKSAELVSKDLQEVGDHSGWPHDQLYTTISVIFFFAKVVPAVRQPGLSLYMPKYEAIAAVLGLCDQWSPALVRDKLNDHAQDAERRGWNRS